MDIIGKGKVSLRKVTTCYSNGCVIGKERKLKGVFPRVLLMFLLISGPMNSFS